MKPLHAIARGSEDYFVYDAHRVARMERSGTSRRAQDKRQSGNRKAVGMAPDCAALHPGYTLRAQHVPVHPAAVEMKERHHGVMMERSGGEALFEFVQNIPGHGMQVGERL